VLAYSGLSFTTPGKPVNFLGIHVETKKGTLFRQSSEHSRSSVGRVAACESQTGHVSGSKPAPAEWHLDDGGSDGYRNESAQMFRFHSGTGVGAAHSGDGRRGVSGRGIQKFLYPENWVRRFIKIGIPAPEVMGSFVGVVEIVCGCCCSSGC